MGANKIRVSEISKSMVALIEAVGMPTFPKREDLREEGWFTVSDYAEATRRSEKTARKILRNSENVDRQVAMCRNGVVEVFRPKTHTRK